MEQMGLIQEKNEISHFYVEYGAGRAGLSSSVAQRLVVLKNYNNMFLIVDRDTRRYK